jgi:capsular polysaccharide biosynthesis protein
LKEGPGTVPTSDLYRHAFTRRWWVILLAAALAVAAAAWATSRQRPVYRATTTMAVIPNSEVAGTEDVLRSLDTLERRTVVATFARIPSAAETRVDAARRMKVPDQDIRSYHIRASVLPNTNIIKVDVEGPDPRLVAAVANAVAATTRREARSMYRIYTMHTLERAVAARRPIHPTPARNYLVAGILGLFLGIAVALLIERLSGPRPT